MRNFTGVKKVVVKIGTNVLTRAESVEIDSNYIRRIARQINHLLQSGREVIIISSGAIGMGASQAGIAKKLRDMKYRQAAAAIGQPVLMSEYKKAFSKYGVTVAQVLLTTEVLNNRRSYLNLRNSVETLLKLGVVPVLNENDSVSTDEIGTAFGDNDKLSALVASKVDADLLIMLTDIDALYDKNPKTSEDAEAISTVYEITKDIERTAGGKGSEHAIGGMRTKIEAAKIASNAGCRLVLANGRARSVIVRIMDGAEVGTIFMPRRKLSNRERWILNNNAEGMIKIDEGAIRALRRKKSLLAKGVTGVKGNFDAGSVVKLNEQAKAVTNFSSVELRRIMGRHSSEIKDIIGPGRRDVVAIPEDIVIIEY